MEGKGGHPEGKGGPPEGKGAHPEGKGEPREGKGAPGGKGGPGRGREHIRREKGEYPEGKGGPPEGKGAHPEGKGELPGGKGRAPRREREIPQEGKGEPLEGKGELPEGKGAHSEATAAARGQSTEAPRGVGKARLDRGSHWDSLVEASVEGAGGTGSTLRFALSNSVSLLVRRHPDTGGAAGRGGATPLVHSRDKGASEQRIPVKPRCGARRLSAHGTVKAAGLAERTEESQEVPGDSLLGIWAMS